MSIWYVCQNYCHHLDFSATSIDVGFNNTGRPPSPPTSVDSKQFHLAEY